MNTTWKKILLAVTWIFWVGLSEFLIYVSLDTYRVWLCGSAIAVLLCILAWHTSYLMESRDPAYQPAVLSRQEKIQQFLKRAYLACACAIAWGCCTLAWKNEMHTAKWIAGFSVVVLFCFILLLYGRTRMKKS